MSPILGFRCTGSFKGKAGDLKNIVVLSEEEQESEIPAPIKKAATSNTCRSKKSELSEETRSIQRKSPQLSKEASSHNRTKSSSSKHNGAATSKVDTPKKSEIPNETRSSLPEEKPVRSKETNSHRSKSTVRSDEGSSKDSEFCGEPVRSEKTKSHRSESTRSKQMGAVTSDEGTSKNSEFCAEPSSVQGEKPSSTKAKNSNQRRTKKKPSTGSLAEMIGLTENGASAIQATVTRKNFEIIKKNPTLDEIFTNHESLPSMAAAYKQFTKTYPEYFHTVAVDKIRAEEYAHLEENGHVCLDYSGYGLFSQAQQTLDKASSSFGLSYISANLPTHALYGGADEGTAEFDIKCRICDFLNVQESEYRVVFTASRGSAFKLLAESYPFHLKKRLLTVYDSKSDAVHWMEETARKKGADVLSATFRWPSQRLWATDLKKKLQEKKKKKQSAKGLFVFPIQSRVTGFKYSYQWMSQAHANEWDVLLDASALGAKVMGSLGLSVFRPDFIVSSFFKVYGSDPTGFGCLLIKHSAIQGLHNSSAARGVGMVRLVPLPAESSSARFSEDCIKDASLDKEKQTGEIVVEEAEDNIQSGAWPRQAGQREVIPIPSFSGSISHFYKAESSNKLSTRALPAFKPERGPELQFGNNSRGTGASSPAFNEQRTEIEACSSRGNPPSLITAHRVSSSELQQKQNDVVFPNRIIEDSACENFELVGAVSYGERGASDSESTSGDWRTYDPQEGNRNVAAEGRASLGSPSQKETEGGPYRSHRRQISASAYYMDSQGDHSFLYSEDAFSVFPDGEEDYDNDESIVSDVDYDVSSVMARKEPEIICRGLNHADMLGLGKTNTRLRCLINWLVGSMLKLRHPGSQGSYRLVQIYGPAISYDRGASVAFNLFDWRGNLLQPTLVQRLADRSNISLGTTTLHHIRFSDNHLGFLEPSRTNNVWTPTVEGHLEGGGKFPSLEVITATLGFITNFEDVYRFWAFLAKFLDADFVSKELWRYRSLNQEMVILGEHESGRSSLHGGFNP